MGYDLGKYATICQSVQVQQNNFGLNLPQGMTLEMDQMTYGVRGRWDNFCFAINMETIEGLRASPGNLDNWLRQLSQEKSRFEQSRYVKAAYGNLICPQLIKPQQNSNSSASKKLLLLEAI